MTKYLALINLLFFIGFFSSGANAQNGVDTVIVGSNDSLQLNKGNTITEAADSSFYEYALQMDIRGENITALCAMRVNSDDDIMGTVMNEFGARFFDFVFDGTKVKIMNVFPAMNKWYIRYVLRKDFGFFCSNFRKKIGVKKAKLNFELAADGRIIVTDSRYKMKYTFSNLKK